MSSIQCRIHIDIHICNCMWVCLKFHELILLNTKKNKARFTDKPFTILHRLYWKSEEYLALLDTSSDVRITCGEFKLRIRIQITIKLQYMRIIHQPTYVAKRSNTAYAHVCERYIHKIILYIKLIFANVKKTVAPTTYLTWTVHTWNDIIHTSM